VKQKQRIARWRIAFLPICFSPRVMMANIPRWLPSRGLLSFFLILSLVRSPDVSDAIQLKTTSSRLVGVGSGGGGGGSSNTNPLQNFISRPVHWPEIVLSSNRVEVIKNNRKQQEASSSKPFSLFRRSQEPTPDASANAAANPSYETLEVGDTVIEFFALNQFQVEWTCTRNEPGRLVVVSPDGVPGIATDCVMDFEFNTAAASSADAIDDDGDATVVTLTMKYTPESPLAVLATPALIVDNWLALNVLLPAAVDTRPLDSFRKLMGILYGIAGIAHLLDLLVGGSQLFTTVAGIPSFENLDLVGQLYALVWCASGPIAYFLSTTAAASPADATDGATIAVNKADIGLVLYGIIELLGAVLSSGFTGAAPDIVSNAGGVQAIVLAAWIYSYQKQQQQQLELSSSD
jgi:hypothetical protein